MRTTLSLHLRWPLRVVGAALLTATAAIHLDLYLTGYRTIPVIGWLFLLQVIAAFALALAVLVVPLIAQSAWLPAVAAAAAGAAFAIATLGGYLLTLWVGLFGFREVRTTAGIVCGIIEVAAFAALALLATATLPAAADTRAAGDTRAAPRSGTAFTATGARTPSSAVPAERSDSAGAAATRPASHAAARPANNAATGPANNAATGPANNAAGARPRAAAHRAGPPSRAGGLRRAALPGVAGLSVAAIVVFGVSVATANGASAGGGRATASTHAVLRTDSVNGVQLLTNSAGLTLYWFAPDTRTSSACYGTCAAYWPPVYGTPTVAPGVTGVTGALGTIHRTDGSTQATYDGHPLYTYIGDTSPGQASGNDVNLNGGFWYDIHVTP
jgi:predicted lipoprotein with Yx(FWY)xxD motif